LILVKYSRNYTLLKKNHWLLKNSLGHERENASRRKGQGERKRNDRSGCRKNRNHWVKRSGTLQKERETKGERKLIRKERSGGKGKGEGNKCRTKGKAVKGRAAWSSIFLLKKKLNRRKPARRKEEERESLEKKKRGVGERSEKRGGGFQEHGWMDGPPVKRGLASSPAYRGNANFRRKRES